MNYIPLGIKTSYSLLSSLVNIKELVKRTKELNITSLAISDNNLFGTMEFYHECIKNNIKPIIGLELEVDQKRIILYAKSYKGYQSLCKLSTIKSEREISFDDLSSYNNDLICVIPFDNVDIYPELEKIYMDIYVGCKKDELGGSNFKRVYFNDVLYLDKSDYKYLPFIYAIRDGKKYTEISEVVDLNNYLMTGDEVLSLVSDELIKNTVAISNKCHLEFPNKVDLLPKYKEGVDEQLYLTELCKKGLFKRLNGKVTRQYTERLEYELSVINKMGFSNYFLVVYDFVKYAKKNNILVGPGRGSAASSLVSYTLGITEVDPLKYNLLFERFLNPERVTMPDIDIDFPDVYRDQVIDYVIKKYGSKRVAQIITFGTLGMKQAVRDVGRVLGLSNKLLDRVSSMLSNDTRENINTIYNKNNRFKELIDSSDSLKILYEVVSKIGGIPRYSSIHAAGIVMSNQDLDEVVPLIKTETGTYITGYSMEYLEELGLLKMDFLGLRNLTTIMNIIDSINKTTNKSINFNDIPLDDSRAMNIFYEANTDGIFQFESIGMKRFLKKLKPTNFEDIVAANALFRPGPMDNIDMYIRRKQGLEKIDYIHPDLVDILKSTYGIIVYQEQIMQIASLMAGYSLGEADILRRAMGKKKADVLVNEKAKFIKRSIERGYEEKISTEVYNLILKFANYGFNRSHSVAYSIIGYKMAYLKVHYPKHFLVNLLTSVSGSEIKTKQYINEARKNNINILKPDINLSVNKYNIDELGVRLPFSIIRNVGVAACNHIINERNNGLYLDFLNFVTRTYSQGVNKKTIESLIYAGCFSSFGYNKKTLINNLDNAINYAELVQNLDASLVEKPKLETEAEFTNEELLEQELNIFGFYLNSHPVINYKNECSNIVDTNAISNYFNKDIIVIIYIDSIKTIKTKKNEDMAFITGTDEYSKIEIVVFPKVWSLNTDFKKGNIIKVFGRVERRLSEYQLIANKIEVLNNI
ncbi:MAG: DNA polymerase III subunit alpha [Bacilli bacterium]|nr:DNA polymerase III subunit alpha [Bacilli bacterium]